MFGYLSEGLPPFWLGKMCQFFVDLQDVFPVYLHVVPLRYTFKVPLSAVSLSIRETEGVSFPGSERLSSSPLMWLAITFVIYWQATP